jgi:hypothetical protein
MAAANTFWNGIAPAPRKVEPPLPLHRTEREGDIIENFARAVHNARVVRCGWCAETVIDDPACSEQPRMISIHDRNLKAPERKQGHRADDDIFNERHRAKGYVKALVRDNEFEVCAACSAKIRDTGGVGARGRGHTICFPQDSLITLRAAAAAAAAAAAGDGADAAPAAAAPAGADAAAPNAAAPNAAPAARLRDLISVHFIGPRRLATTVGGELRRGALGADRGKILRAFDHLVASHPLYAGAIVDRETDFEAQADEIALTPELVTDAPRLARASRSAWRRAWRARASRAPTARTSRRRRSSWRAMSRCSIAPMRRPTRRATRATF